MRQSLRHSCRTELTRQGISLPSDRQGYSRRLLGLKLISYTYSFSSYSTGQASDSIHHYKILQSPVFLLNSRYLLFYEIVASSLKIKHNTTTLLIPKLQSYFAEFLQLLSLIAVIYSTNPPVSVFIYFSSSCL